MFGPAATAPALLVAVLEHEEPTRSAVLTGRSFDRWTRELSPHTARFHLRCVDHAARCRRDQRAGELLAVGHRDLRSALLVGTERAAPDRERATAEHDAPAEREARAPGDLAAHAGVVFAIDASVQVRVLIERLERLGSLDARHVVSEGDRRRAGLAGRNGRGRLDRR